MQKDEKQLLYTCLGGSPAYVEVFLFMIRSLMRNPSCQCTTPVFDFLIIVDENLHDHIKDIISGLSSECPFRIFTYRANTDHDAYKENKMAPSYLKLHLFAWPEVWNYASALFIDADIIIPPMFDVVQFVKHQACNLEKVEDGYLYAMKEFEDVNMHKMHYFDLHDYTDEEISAFERDGVYAFNTGLYSVRIGPETRRIFSDILTMIHTSPDPRIFFYEQSFMNAYLNRNRRARYDVITDAHCVLFVRPESAYVPKLLHFCGEASDGQSKTAFMRAFCEKYWPELCTDKTD